MYSLLHKIEGISLISRTVGPRSYVGFNVIASIELSDSMRGCGPRLRHLSTSTIGGVLVPC